jgi:hypothetical protein
MNNDENNSLHFVCSVSRLENRCEATVISLIHASGPPAFPWNAWVMHNAPFEVRCAYPETVLRSRISYPSQQDRLRAMVQATVEINVDCSAVSIPVPFYLAGNANRKPSAYEVIVHLLFDTVDFLPQVQASIYRRQTLRKELWEMRVEDAEANKGWLHRFVERLLPKKLSIKEPSFPAEDEVEIRTRTQEPFPGLYLPVSLVGIEVPSVLLLRESRGSHIFSGTLYVSDTLREVQVPIALVSTGIWADEDELHLREKVIGSIVEITSGDGGDIGGVGTRRAAEDDQS